MPFALSCIHTAGCVAGQGYVGQVAGLGYHAVEAAYVLALLRVQQVCS